MTKTFAKPRRLPADSGPFEVKSGPAFSGFGVFETANSATLSARSAQWAAQLGEAAASREDAEDIWDNVPV